MYLTAENFSKEIVLWFNLGPMHLLDGFNEEILALDDTKSYLSKLIEIGKIVTDNLNESVSLESLQKKKFF